METSDLKIFRTYFESRTEVCSNFYAADGPTPASTAASVKLVRGQKVAWTSWNNEHGFPADSKAICIQTGNFKEDPVRELPTWIANNPRVESLSMPDYFWNKLKPGGLPPNLRCLVLLHQLGSPKMALRDDLSFPTITFLDAERNRRPEEAFMFSEDTFPNLEQVNISFDKKFKMLDVLPNCRRLSVAKFYNCGQSAAIFDKLAPLPIKAAVLAIGATSLEGIEKWPQLEELWIRDHRALKDLSPLKKLPKLRKLLIWHCHQITSANPLLEMNLDALWIYECKGLRTKDEKGLQELKKKWPSFDNGA